MTRTELDLSPLVPFDRETAARIASVASHFEARLTLECDGVVLNAKSMLGLLSQTRVPNGRFSLVADGPDEAAATEALIPWLKKAE